MKSTLLDRLVGPQLRDGICSRGRRQQSGSKQRRLAQPPSWRRLPCSAIISPPSKPLLAPYVEAAVKAAWTAARVARHVREQSFFVSEDVQSKSDKTPVTVCDFGVQAVVSLVLEAAFPAVPFIAEEDSISLRWEPPILSKVVHVVNTGLHSEGLHCVDEDAVLAAIDRGGPPFNADGSYGASATRPPSLRWILDPIDGTVGFVRGGDAQYAVGLALVTDTGDVLIGVLALVNWSLAPCTPSRRGVIIAASAGGGTWSHLLHEAADAPWTRVQLPAGDAKLSNTTMCISDHENWKSVPIARAAEPEVPAELLRMCCGSLVKYASVALGHASVFIQHSVSGVNRLKAWDHAAGVAVVVEAGGVVSDFSGAPACMGGDRLFVPAGLGLVVSTKGMHPTVMAMVRKVVPSRKEPLLVLLDRDGVLNVDLGTWITSPEQVQLTPGAAHAVAALNAAGHTLAVVSNQSCIGRGLITWKQLRAINDRIEELLEDGQGRLQAIFVAPDDPSLGQVTDMRKPGPGMLHAAMQRFGVPPERTAMVGDTLNDMAAAAAAGVRRKYLVCSGHHGERFAIAAKTAGQALPVVVADSSSSLASLFPTDLLPLELHRDLQSVANALSDVSEVQ